ncbi:MAG: hypothetical protein QM811_16815 [Pirellulales bacterium]
MPNALTNKVPQSALKMSFDAGLTFVDESIADADGVKKHPLKMRARGGQPVWHWMWGTCVHDMAGFMPDKPVIPVDWCHTNEVLGALDTYDASNDGLDVAGFLAELDAKDRVATLKKQSNAGIPYQSSIFFVPLAIEQIPEGVKAEVNGYELAGPALIFRKWSVRGVALCPYGHDNETNSQFSAGHDGEVELPFSFAPMKKTNTQPPAADPTAADPTKLSADAVPAGGNAAGVVTTVKPKDANQRAQSKLQAYITRFGATNGAKWFAEGKTFKQAVKLHVRDLQTQLSAKATELAAKDAENAALQARIQQAKPGELSIVPSSDGEPGKPGEAGGPPTKFAHLGGIGRMAAAMKLPK